MKLENSKILVNFKHKQSFCMLLAAQSFISLTVISEWEEF